MYRETRRTTSFAIMCLCGLLLLGVTGLYPAHVKEKQLKQLIMNLNEERNVQQLLQPFFIALMTAEDAIKYSPELLHVEQKPLPREGLLDFDKRIIDLAEEFDMKAISVVVKVDEINQSDLVAVDALLAGDFMNFRRFLLSLGQVPWVHTFDSVEIAGFPSQEKMKIKFKLALE